MYLEVIANTGCAQAQIVQYPMEEPDEDKKYGGKVALVLIQ